MQQIGDNFSFKIVSGDGEEKVILDGVIDEYVQLNLVKPSSSDISLDLGGIRRLNSVGVREFCNFMERLKDRRVRVTRCSQAIVSQANLVSGFLGNAVIESFFVPLFCDACDDESELLVLTHEYKKSGLPAQSCASCGAGPDSMGFDGEAQDEKFYLSFLDAPPQ